jgi:hypothetical protein
LKTPYPWFGGKADVAAEVWRRFGTVRNYCEPFFGGGAIFLGRPQPFEGTETINDINGWVTNLWRALQADPDGVAAAADWPVSELDLHARGDWLFYRHGVAEWLERLRADPQFYDVQSAGWWVWGCCSWIGTGWGPRQLPHLGDAGRGVNRKRPHLGNAGRGVNRKRPHLGNAGQGVNRQLPHLSDAGQGVNRQLPHLSDAGQGDDSQTSRGAAMRDYLRVLAERLRGVRICCGDWSRICGPTPTVKQGLTAVFLDPPYAVEDRADCYDENEDRSVAHDVREWCKQWTGDNRIRIALCGYAGEHNELEPMGWTRFDWKARGGFGSQSKAGNENCRRERIWFSPSCLIPQRQLF